MIYIVEHFGVPPESVWPYISGDRTLPAGQTWAKLDAEARHFARFFRLAGYDEIAPQLRQNRLVVAELPIYESWLEQPVMTTGEIPLPPAGAPVVGMHALVITAVDPGATTLRFANIWGTQWGQGGFGVMSEDVARAYLFDPTAGDKLWAVGWVR